MRFLTLWMFSMIFFAPARMPRPRFSKRVRASRTLTVCASSVIVTSMFFVNKNRVCLREPFLEQQLDCVEQREYCVLATGVAFLSEKELHADLQGIDCVLVDRAYVTGSAGFVSKTGLCGRRRRR